MALTKQAKTLTKRQVALALAYLDGTRYQHRNRVVLLLSVKAGMRAKEIANLTWSMVTGSDGHLSDVIRLENRASKGSRGGRVIPINPELKQAMRDLYETRPAHAEDYVITTERCCHTSSSVIVNLFASWYRDLGFHGCSSHSGRRTFITNAAKQITTVGGSLRDVQALAGHSALSTTQRYIESDVEAQRRVVALL